EDEVEDEDEDEDEDEVEVEEYEENGHENGDEDEDEDEDVEEDEEYGDIDEEYEYDDSQDTENFENEEDYLCGDHNFDFNVMDNFRFRSIHFFESYKFKKKSCIKNNVNEDNQVYCTFDEDGDSNSTIPIYSKQLWKECLHLLANNKTITDLSIGYSRCGYHCFGKDKPMDQQLIDDFLDSLSNNQSIKRLCFNFSDQEMYYPFMKPEFILPLLQRNSTLENIYAQVIFDDDNDTLKSMIEDLSKSMPSDSKCKIKHFSSYRMFRNDELKNLENMRIKLHYDH
ncbi:hypothetical protein CYY_010082, partial [Polysphondylium violaceum]